MPLSRAGAFGTGQLVAVQAAALALVLTLPAQWWLRATAAALLVVVAVLAVVRYRARWLHAWAGVLWAYRRRRRDVDGPLADVEVEAFVDRAGTRFGVVVADGTFTTVVAVEPVETASVAVPSPDTVDMAALARVLTDRDVRLTSVQVLLRSVSAPTPRVDPRAAVAESYREVGAGVEAQRGVLVCLRLDPALCPGAVAARGGGDLGACRALASLTARLAASLEDGIRVRVLGPDEVRGALASGIGTATGPVREGWRGVESPEAVHLAFRFAGWRGRDPTVLLAELASAWATVTVLSLTVLPARRGALDVRFVLRVVGPPGLRAPVEAAVAAAARRAGVRSVRMDGQHAAALAQTLPTGGRRWTGAAARDSLLRVDQAWLRRARLPLDRGGLVLGRDAAGRTVVAQLFRDRPGTMSAWLDQRVVMVLCYRALAVGARVTVMSARPERWLPLRWAGVDDPQAVTVASPEYTSGSDSRADRPHLLVVDAPDGLEQPPPPQPWQTVLTVLPDLSTRNLQAARAAGPVILRRPSRDEAAATAPFLGLPSGADRVLTSLTDEQFCTIERGRLVVVNLGLTGAESHLVVAATGAPAGSAAESADPRVRAQHGGRQR